MPRWLLVTLSLMAIAAILATTRAGRRLRARLPTPLRSGRAPKQDRAYLLRVCGGDRRHVARLVADARRRDPDMTEAQAYRRAIRTHLRGAPRGPAEPSAPRRS